MKEKTCRMVTFNIVMYSKDNKEAIEYIRLSLQPKRIRGDEVGTYVVQSKLTKAIAVKQMEFDQDKKEWVVVGNGGD